MKYYPDNLKEVEELNAKDWMIECLKMNPDYLGWGVYEDYMSSDNGGWDSRVIVDCWDDFNFQLDDLNEMVNFYFSLERDNCQCHKCEGCGYNEETKKIYDDWYDLANTGRRWDSKLTQHEVDALVDANRLFNFTHNFVKGQGWVEKSPKYVPTADEVNAWNSRGLGHDSINKYICVKARAQREGVFGHCDTCNGDGYIFTEDNGRLAITFWILHPRKGCSRGVMVKNIKETELDKVKKYILDAKNRNNDRFSKVIL